jgi:hypothetical protein
LAYSSTLKMEVTSSSETSFNFQRPTRRYIPEARRAEKETGIGNSLRLGFQRTKMECRSCTLFDVSIASLLVSRRIPSSKSRSASSEIPTIHEHSFDALMNS